MSTSRSSNQSQANQTQTTETTNLNLQDTSGITIAGNSGRLNFTTTDFNSVATAGELGLEALDLGRRSVESSIDFAGRGVDSVVNATRDVNRDSLDFAGRSLDTVAKFAETAGGGVLDFAKGLVNDSVAGFQSLSMQTSASTDDRVAKVAMYAFAAVAVTLVLPQLFKKAA